MFITSWSLRVESKRFPSMIFRNKCKLSTKFTNIMIMCIFKGWLTKPHNNIAILLKFTLVLFVCLLFLSVLSPFIPLVPTFKSH